MPITICVTTQEPQRRNSTGLGRYRNLMAFPFDNGCNLRLLNSSLSYLMLTPMAHLLKTTPGPTCGTSPLGAPNRRQYAAVGVVFARSMRGKVHGRRSREVRGDLTAATGTAVKGVIPPRES